MRPKRLSAFLRPHRQASRPLRRARLERSREAARKRRLGKSWSQGWISGKPCNFGLGPFPFVTVAEAREAALENARVVYQGRDPRERSTIPTATVGIRFGGVLSNGTELARPYRAAPGRTLHYRIRRSALDNQLPTVLRCAIDRRWIAKRRSGPRCVDRDDYIAAADANKCFTVAYCRRCLDRQRSRGYSQVPMTDDSAMPQVLDVDSPTPCGQPSGRAGHFCFCTRARPRFGWVETVLRGAYT